MEAAFLLEELDHALPGFRQFALSKENYFGTETVHRLFLCATDFVREGSVSTTSWERLAQFINASVGGSDDALDNAVCTCFLENLAERDHPLRALLGERALKFWVCWEPEPD